MHRARSTEHWAMLSLATHRRWSPRMNNAIQLMTGASGQQRLAGMSPCYTRVYNGSAGHAIHIPQQHPPLLSHIGAFSPDFRSPFPVHVNRSYSFKGGGGGAPDASPTGAERPRISDLAKVIKPTWQS